MNKDLFDWVGPELREWIDRLYEPEQPWRTLRQSPPDGLIVPDLVRPGDRIAIAKPGQNRVEALVKFLEPVKYSPEYRYSQLIGVKIPDGCVPVAWHLGVNYLHTAKTIARCKRYGLKQETQPGDPMRRCRNIGPFVAENGRILSMTYTNDNPDDDAEIIVVEQADREPEVVDFYRTIPPIEYVLIKLPPIRPKT